MKIDTYLPQSEESNSSSSVKVGNKEKMDITIYAQFVLKPNFCPMVHHKEP